MNINLSGLQTTIIGAVAVIVGIIIAVKAASNYATSQAGRMFGDFALAAVALIFIVGGGVALLTNLGSTVTGGTTSTTVQTTVPPAAP